MLILGLNQKQGPGCPEFKTWETLDFSKLTIGPQQSECPVKLDKSNPGDSSRFNDNKYCEKS